MIGHNNAAGPDRTEVQGRQDPLDVTEEKVGGQIEGTFCFLKHVNELGRKFCVGRCSGNVMIVSHAQQQSVSALRYTLS